MSFKEELHPEFTKDKAETEFTFEAEAKVVKELFKGAIIVSGRRRFLVMEVDGYNADDVQAQFVIAQDEPVGTVTGSPYRGTLTFANITTGERGLVMPRAVNEIMPNGATRYVFGPDRVARELGIEQNGRYQMEVDDPSAKILRLQEFPNEIS